MSGFEVVTKAVRAEATKWRELADRVKPIHDAVLNKRLSPSAFFVGDPSTLMETMFEGAVHYYAYDKFVSFMDNLLGGAVAEFPQISQALIDTADTYDRADKIVELDLNKIYGR